MTRKPEGTLRRGWTTGACATAATRAAYTALLTGHFPDPVTIVLPKGERPAFALAREEQGPGYALAGIVKDAGDDPDVTHGALVLAKVSQGPAGSGVTFRAGAGVGTVTKPGLPIPVGEPAINPVPREMMCAAIAEVAAEQGASGDAAIEISVAGGEALAAKTWNPRLGIVGGLSILGPPGVARATGLSHVAGYTGSTSERAVQSRYGLPDEAMLDMGDFAGGLLKYLRRHPLPRLTLGGGFGKISKLAMGHLDLHSGRSQVDFDWLAGSLEALGAAPVAVEAARQANTANQVLQQAVEAGLPLADRIAAGARATALGVLDGQTEIEVLVFDRTGTLVGRAHD